MTDDSDLDRMAREAFEVRPGDEPTRHPLTHRQWAIALLTLALASAAVALIAGEDALVGVIGGVIFASLTLGFESFRRRR